MPHTIRNELAVLSQITEFFLETHNGVSHFLRDVLLKVNELIPSDLSFVGIVEESEGAQWIVVRDPAHVTIGAEAGEWQRHFGRLKIGGDDLPDGLRSFVGIVAYSKTLRRSDDVTKEPFYRTSNDKIRSEIAIPVLFQDEVLAVINLESKEHSFFTAEHEHLLSLIATLIALPLHSLMVSEGLRRPVIDVLDRIAECISAVPVAVPLAATDVLDKVASILALALRSSLCQIWVQVGESLVLRGTFAGSDQPTHSELDTEAWAQKALAERRLIRIGRSYDEAGDRLKSASSVPAIAAPMLTTGTAIGAIVVGFKKGPTSSAPAYYSGADEHLINIAQGQIATAIQFKTMEITRREQSYERARQLSHLARVFARLDLDEVLENAVLRLPELCRSRYCSVFLWSQERKQFVLAASKGLTEKPGDAAYYPGEGLTGWVGLHGKPLLLDSRTQDTLAKIAPDLVWKSKYNEARDKEDRSLHPFAAVPIFGDGQIIGILRLSDRIEGTFSESDELVMTLVADKIAGVIAYRERYEERILLLRGLQDIMTVTRDLHRANADLQAVKGAFLRKAAAIAWETFGADIVMIYAVNGDGVEAPAVIEGELLRPDLMSAAHTPDLPAAIISGGVSRYWGDARSDHLLAKDGATGKDAAPKPRFVEREAIVSSAGIRLSIAENALGVMFLNYRTPHKFDTERRGLIEAFATQLALSLETMALYTQVRASASREEAAALAHELHDVVSVLATGIVSKAGTILDRLQRRDYSKKRLREDLRSVEKYAGSCIAELREIVGELREPRAGSNTWPDMLENHIAGLKPRGLKVNLEIDPMPTVPAAVNRHLYLIVRELFSNVLMHANARSVSIHAEHHDARLAVTVQDDGLGFDPGTIHGQKPSSLGLLGVRHRVTVLKGTLEIDSRPNGGTLVIVDIPLPPAATASHSTASTTISLAE
jgi:signal transduction histidine kinase